MSRRTVRRGTTGRGGGEGDGERAFAAFDERGLIGCEVVETGLVIVVVVVAGG